MTQLFGTDGIRGVANRHPMTPEMAVAIGKAAATFFKPDGKKNAAIIIGKDTRQSGDMLQAALASGICAAGGSVYLTGTLPTPGVAFLTSSMPTDAGVVISASHNPYFDNGVKLFNSKGYKLSQAEEARLEKMIVQFQDGSRIASGKMVGTIQAINDAGHQYASFLKQCLNPSFSIEKTPLVIDCSNGATYKVAPKVFNDLGADVTALFVKPDGKNINADCGSQHTETLQEKVLASGASAGLAFDGDGDRLIAVDEKGEKLTGDQLLAICAQDMQARGTLKNNLLVSTVMSNMGLGQALKKMGVKHLKTGVGDRLVMEEMVASDAILGGEESGHTIFRNHHTTGDGLLTALMLLEAIQRQQQPLSELKKIMTVFPQKLIGVKVQSKPDLTSIADVQAVIKSVEDKLKDHGRVLVRYSGTEPLCRVMVEGPTPDETEQRCQQIADIISKTLS
ncbi:phosphoglucosamine mutase [Desulfococcaceae bacterium HSG9]|nr:phosphoglucosamine mutase [Desulfococcaceae bacterium HSG9]